VPGTLEYSNNAPGGCGRSSSSQPLRLPRFLSWEHRLHGDTHGTNLLCMSDPSDYSSGHAACDEIEILPGMLRVSVAASSDLSARSTVKRAIWNTYVLILLKPYIRITYIYHIRNNVTVIIICYFNLSLFFFAAVWRFYSKKMCFIGLSSANSPRSFHCHFMVWAVSACSGIARKHSRKNVQVHGTSTSTTSVLRPTDKRWNLWSAIWDASNNNAPPVHKGREKGRAGTDSLFASAAACFISMGNVLPFIAWSKK